MMKKISIEKLKIGDYIQISDDWWSPVLSIDDDLVITEMADVQIDPTQTIWIL